MSENDEHGISSAAKLFNDVLRSIDYTFISAIGDIVDNSVAAGASSVVIECDVSLMTLVISDNGSGMSESTHIESMKIASKSREYSQSDLGKFGSGMKFASLSQCRKLTVATKRATDSDISVRLIDLNYVVENDDLTKIVQKLSAQNLPSWVADMLTENSGTAVIWDEIDKVFIADEGGGRSRQEIMRSHLAELEEYLSATFSRFITPSSSGKAPLKIVLNGNEIEPWDPFLLRLKETTVFPTLEVPFRGSFIKLTGYVLPGKRQLDAIGKGEHARAGRGRWPSLQGFWVYRQDRLIRGGGWLGLSNSSEPHTQLARVSFEFPSELDHDLQLPVDKSNIQLPKQLAFEIKDYVRKVVSEANKRYREQSKLVSPRDLLGSRTPPPPVIRKASAKVLAREIDQLATETGVEQAVKVIKYALREKHSALADEIGW